MDQGVNNLFQVVSRSWSSNGNVFESWCFKIILYKQKQEWETRYTGGSAGQTGGKNYKTIDIHMHIFSGLGKWGRKPYQEEKNAHCRNISTRVQQVPLGTVNHFTYAKNNFGETTLSTGKKMLADRQRFALAGSHQGSSTINESDRDGGGGIEPKASRVELEVKVREKNSVLSVKVITTLPPGKMREGKVWEAKSHWMDLERIRKGHCTSHEWNIIILVKEQIWQDSGQRYTEHEIQQFAGCRYPLSASFLMWLSQELFALGLLRYEEGFIVVVTLKIFVFFCDVLYT